MNVADAALLMRRLPLALLLTLSGFIMPPSVMAIEPGTPIYAQVLLGQLQLNDDSLTLTREGEQYDGKLDSLPYLGAAAQVVWRDGVIGYGWEGGGFVSWINDHVDYFALSDRNGLRVWIHADNVFWSVETFMGLFASLKPVHWLRCYVAGGPLAIYAVAKTEDAQTETVATATTAAGTTPRTTGGSTIVIDVTNKDTDFHFGGYARAGFDLQFSDTVWAGFSVRYMKTRLKLEDSLGRLNIDAPLYQFSLTQRL